MAVEYKKRTRSEDLFKGQDLTINTSKFDAFAEVRNAKLNTEDKEIESLVKSLMKKEFETKTFSFEERAVAMGKLYKLNQYTRYFLGEMFIQTEARIEESIKNGEQIQYKNIGEWFNEYQEVIGIGSISTLYKFKLIREAVSFETLEKVGIKKAEYMAKYVDDSKIMSSINKKLDNIASLTLPEFRLEVDKIAETRLQKKREQQKEEHAEILQRHPIDVYATEKKQSAISELKTNDNKTIVPAKEFKDKFIFTCTFNTEDEYKRFLYVWDKYMPKIKIAMDKIDLEKIS